MTDTGEAELMYYETPLIGPSQDGEGQHLPLIVGLKAMKKKEAVLELANGKEYMTFPGPGGYKIQWSPGTKRFPLKIAKSGHLVISCSNFDKLPTQQSGVQTPIQTLHVVPDSDAEDAAAVGTGTPPNLSPSSP